MTLTATFTVWRHVYSLETRATLPFPRLTRELQSAATLRSVILTFRCQESGGEQLGGGGGVSLIFHDLNPLQTAPCFSSGWMVITE